MSKGYQRLEIQAQLKIFFRRLKRARPARTADEALVLVSRTLIAVEDRYCGVAPVFPPPLKYHGRMYPPLEDRIERHDKGIRAYTAGHVIEIDVPEV